MANGNAAGTSVMLTPYALGEPDRGEVLLDLGFGAATA